jgi:hypothetical protein
VRPVGAQIVTADSSRYRLLWNCIAWPASELETDRQQVDGPVAGGSVVALVFGRKNVCSRSDAEIDWPEAKIID